MTAADQPRAEHGYGPYSNGCRCEVCRYAKAEYMRSRRAQGRQRARETTTPKVPGILHGSRAGYEEHGCRCALCKATRAAYGIHGRGKPHLTRTKTEAQP